MAADDSINPMRRQDSPAGFRISDGPVIPHGKPDLFAALAEFGELPKNYGIPILFAIPRDPRTIFASWNIDWADVFARATPIDRQVYLRVKRSDGSDEIEQPVEPMMGSHYALVAQPQGVYQLDLGFYESEGAWNSIAVSEQVTMPPDRLSGNVEVDVATVPFHLSFQRMLDLFRASNGDAIASILSRLQSRATNEADEDLLNAEEWEVLRAMNFSLAEAVADRRAFGDDAEEALRKRAEAILGFGATSPKSGPGGSSWASAGS
jgi:hypothetical protein